jgi:hypothetical protein
MKVSVQSLLSLFLCLSLGSCDPIANTKEPEVYYQNSVEVDTTVSIEHEDLVNFKCAVVVSPDEDKFNIDKSSYESINDSLATETQLYLSDALHYLDSTSTKVLARKSKGEIVFQLKSGKKVMKNLSAYSWQILFFNGFEEPKEVDMSIIDKEFKAYMK